MQTFKNTTIIEKAIDDLNIELNRLTTMQVDIETQLNTYGSLLKQKNNTKYIVYKLLQTELENTLQQNYNKILSDTPIDTSKIRDYLAFKHKLGGLTRVISQESPLAIRDKLYSIKNIKIDDIHIITYPEIIMHKSSMSELQTTSIKFNDKSSKYNYLSNLFKASFKSSKENRGPKPYTWKSVSHYYNAHLYIEKGVNPDKDAIAENIRNLPDPLDTIDYKTDIAIRADLNTIIQGDNSYINPYTIKDEIMENAIFQKFAQNTSIRNKLLALKNKHIIYSSPDSYWGAGAKGKGENKLGNILMNVRDNLLDNDSSSESDSGSESNSDSGSESNSDSESDNN